MRGAILLALLLLTAAAARADAERRVPQDWLGVTVDRAFSPADAGEWNRMVAAGVETVRTRFLWAQLQPYRTAQEVPAADAPRFTVQEGVPTDFSATDAIVIAAAERRVTVLPVVEWAPGWAAARQGAFGAPPARPEDVSRVFRALAARYGPRGSLWQERPSLPRRPIRRWQVFNEPNLKGFWPIRPFAPSYVVTLRAAARGIRAVDRSATVVLAGLTGESWTALRSLYRAGARGSFDAVSIHPYTARPADVLRIARYMRRVMARHGDRRLPIWVTELSWPAAAGRLAEPPPWAAATDTRQARLLRQGIRRLVRARKRLRIGSVYWYTWLSVEGKSWFDYSGLRRVRRGQRVDTPALRAFRRTARRLQGCTKRPTDARCPP
jgi:hypothetical protein